MAHFGRFSDPQYKESLKAHKNSSFTLGSWLDYSWLDIKKRGLSDLFGRPLFLPFVRFFSGFDELFHF